MHTENFNAVGGINFIDKTFTHGDNETLLARNTNSSQSGVKHAHPNRYRSILSADHRALSKRVPRRPLPIANARTTDTRLLRPACLSCFIL
jgi:hypothetical protein